MRPDGATDGHLSIVHVITTGERRGAEMFAFDLIRALNGSFSQRVAVLRGSFPLPLAFEAPTEILPSNGHRLPGLRIDVRTLRGLRRLVSESDPDVVHAHGAEAFKYSVLATRGRDARVLYRRIGLASPSVTHGMRRVAHANLMKQADQIVAVAEAVHRETVDVFGVPRERVVTLPRGIDPSRLEATTTRSQTRADLQISEDAGVVLSLGALHPQKDPVAHVEVAAKVLRALPDTVQLIAGDGVLRHEVDAAIDAHGLRGRVRLLGNRADVGDLLHASDVVLLASRTEGMPGCLIEAGMSGLPVASYAVAGTPEVVTDGVTGYLVPQGDQEALASRVVRLLEDEALRRRMGAAARDRCRASFDIGSIATRYADLYQELCA